MPGWLTQCYDNVTEWDIMTWCWWPDFPMGHWEIKPSTSSSHYECALSKVDTYPDMI